FCALRSNARAHRPQQESGEMRMIRRLRFLARCTSRLCTADRGYMWRGTRSGRRGARGGRGLRCSGRTAALVGVPWLALAARLASAALSFPGALALAVFARMIAILGCDGVDGKV